MQVRVDSTVVHEQVIQVDLTGIEVDPDVMRVVVEFVMPNGRPKRVTVPAYAFDASAPTPVRPTRRPTPVA